VVQNIPRLGGFVVFLLGGLQTAKIRNDYFNVAVLVLKLSFGSAAVAELFEEAFLRILIVQSDGQPGLEDIRGDHKKHVGRLDVPVHDTTAVDPADPSRKSSQNGLREFFGELKIETRRRRRSLP
jgi:hypothetical protein